MLRIGRAGRKDFERLRDIDPFADAPARQVLLAASLQSGEVWSAVADDAIAGFAILNRHFFQQPFIELVMVAEAMRRCGIGRSLVKHCIGQTPAEKVWTSTNRSNVAMQGLLAGAGFIRSGQVDNLDPGDPELIFVHLPKVTPVESAAR